MSLITWNSSENNKIEHCAGLDGAVIRHNNLLFFVSKPKISRLVRPKSGTWIRLSAGSPDLWLAKRKFYQKVGWRAFNEFGFCQAVSEANNLLLPAWHDQTIRLSKWKDFLLARRLRFQDNDIIWSEMKLWILKKLITVLAASTLDAKL